VLATTGLDKTVRLWRVEDGKPLTEPLSRHQDGVLSASFSPDGKTLATASRDQTVILWDVDATSWESRACSIARRNLRLKEWPKTFVDVRVNPGLRKELGCSGFPLLE
jgi:WD40 repeat protein